MIKKTTILCFFVSILCYVDLVRAGCLGRYVDLHLVFPLLLLLKILSLQLLRFLYIWLLVFVRQVTPHLAHLLGDLSGLDVRVVSLDLLPVGSSEEHESILGLLGLERSIRINFLLDLLDLLALADLDSWGRGCGDDVVVVEELSDCELGVELVFSRQETDEILVDAHDGAGLLLDRNFEGSSDEFGNSGHVCVCVNVVELLWLR